MGNTLADCLVGDCLQDHPHIHGEYLSVLQIKLRTAGSPPHTWGIQLQDQGEQVRLWITPTYMGNTEGVNNCVHNVKDHPHIHGEYYTDFRRFHMLTGSPHIHGEYFLACCLIPAGTGSPPHTWGIQRLILMNSAVSRITPTYMGNTNWAHGTGGRG